jgi:LacI family transcriptional regulator
MTKKNIRIKDIAREAGVSAGTVDRVLHSRGKVSEVALAKVMAVLNNIEYKPNPIAQMLGAFRSYQVAALLPNPKTDEYWSMAMKGIAKGATEWSRYGIHVQTFGFDTKDKASFEKAAEELFKSNPDGIITAPIFYHETLPFFESCREKGIPYVLFNTQIKEADPLAFYGQDLYQSGRVAAELLSLGHDSGEFGILHFDEDPSDSVHLLEKEKGLRNFIAEKMGPAPIHSLNRINSSDAQFKYYFQELISNPNLKGLFASTSMGTSLAAELLHQYGKNSIRLVGYDLLEVNVQFLKSGIIDFLIHQNPTQQALLGLTCIANHLVFKKQTPALNLFALEIITRQNLSSYLPHQENVRNQEYVLIPHQTN